MPCSFNFATHPTLTFPSLEALLHESERRGRGLNRPTVEAVGEIEALETAVCPKDLPPPAPAPPRLLQPTAQPIPRQDRQRIHREEHLPPVTVDARPGAQDHIRGQLSNLPNGFFPVSRFPNNF